MNLRYIGCILIGFLLTGCYTDDFFEENKEAFYKLYGNGTQQEAIAMELTAEGEIFILGNQYVRNQDSSAVLLIRADAEGNQLWSRKFFGKGHTTARRLLVLPDNELLVLASSRLEGASVSIPVLYRINREGELLEEHFLGQEGGATSLSSIPEDMVTGENGTLFVLGNLRAGSSNPQKGFIKKLAIETAVVLDEVEFSNSPEMEAKCIMRSGEQLLVMGDTRQEVGEISNKNIFLGTFSIHLVQDGLSLLGGSQDDIFKRAVVSSRNELVILSQEKDPTSSQSSGVVSFLSPNTFAQRRTASIFGTYEIPVAIEEDMNGDFYVAVDAWGEKGNSSIRITKIDPAGTPLWEAPREIGGEGDDDIAQVKVQHDFVFLLKTIDMKNENKLISLSKIRF